MAVDIDSLPLETPAFIYDESAIARSLSKLRGIADKTGCKILYSLKAFSMVDALRLMGPSLDGFAASSLFEAELARRVVSTKSGTLHFTTPGLKSDELSRIAELCDYITFNSLTQWETFHERVDQRLSCGVRVNPQLSYIDDDRYDPCRPNSKLGIPLPLLVERITECTNQFNELRGIHFHTNCESLSLQPLFETVSSVVSQLGFALNKMDWINLGGGYLYTEAESLQPLYRAVELLVKNYSLDVFLEPGEDIVGGAGSVISSVIDLFDSGDKQIAVMDTTVNHLPGVFTYGSKPYVKSAKRDGSYTYLLAGSTCLAGDIFGEYAFDHPLNIGSRITFERVGGYSLVKANMFNGVNLPNIYSLSDNKVILKKRYTLKDFLSRWESG